jgi:excisionase family DNA binding protein
MEPAQTGQRELPQGRGRLMRIPEVAERLGIAKSTAYELIYKGHLPALQLRGRGSTVRVDENELERFIYEQGEAE